MPNFAMARHSASSPSWAMKMLLAGRAANYGGERNDDGGLRRDPRPVKAGGSVFFPEDNHSAMGRVVSTSGSAELSSAKSSRASISRVKASAGLLASCGVEASVVGGVW